MPFGQWGLSSVCLSLVCLTSCSVYLYLLEGSFQASNYSCHSTNNPLYPSIMHYTENSVMLLLKWYPIIKSGSMSWATRINGFWHWLSGILCVHYHTLYVRLHSIYFLSLGFTHQLFTSCWCCILCECNVFDKCVVLWFDTGKILYLAMDGCC